MTDRLSSLADQLNTRLAGRYRIERELGRGGMATVFLVRDERHDRSVALKVLDPQLAEAYGRERFLREIDVAARLQHPNILTVFDSGDANGLLWFTMPFVDGETLRARLEREPRLPLPDAIRIAQEAARALDYAHQHGVLHRDIKPENLLLTRDGSTLVADFGIARPIDAAESMTQTGLVLGTPAYMSPEQATGERTLDARTDVYSLACVVYEMLAGEAPYTGRTVQALLAKRLSEPVPKLRTVRDVPAAVEAAVTTALARDPADRFASCGAFLQALTAPISVARGRPWPLVSVVLVAALAIGAFAWWRSRAVTAAGDSSAAVATAAVLPFADLSEHHDQEYFSDGLTDELISVLGQVNGIRVAARTSAFQFKGREIDVREVGKKLGVGAVLEGSVRRSGNQVRIAVSLVNTQNGYQLWASEYNRELSDVFAVQEEIARAIVSALRLTLGARSDTALRSRPTRNLDAYQLYLKGRFAWNQRTEKGMAEAVRYLEQAVALDSGYALAWASLADAYVLAIPFAHFPRDPTWPNARRAASRALALDSTLGEAHTALAYGAMIYDWDWETSEARFRDAIRADSTYPTGHQWYGDLLWSRGRLDEAMVQMRRAQMLDPLSRQIACEVAGTFYRQHRYAQTDSVVQAVIALDPNYASAYYQLGQSYLMQHREREAVALLRRAIDLGGFQEDLGGAMAYAYAVVGDRAAFDSTITDLKRRMSDGSSGPFALALAYAGKGDTAVAIDWLQRAISAKDAYVPEDFFDPMLDGLRRDPKFGALDRAMRVK